MGYYSELSIDTRTCGEADEDARLDRRDGYRNVAEKATPMFVNTDQKYNLISQPVTLDGRPAKISGAHRQFAIVATLDPDGPAVEFAWTTVARVVADGGKFASA